MKKLENYIKKEAEIRNWREHAGPEEIDYYECQNELKQNIEKSYYNVDRIIGKYLFIIKLVLYPLISRHM